MLAAFAQSENGRPIILAYTRDNEEGFRKQFENAADDQFRAIIDQRDLARSFVKEQFQDADGRNIRAFHSDPEPTAFVQLAGGPVKLLIVLDQLEELWTDARITTLNRVKFFEAIEQLAKCGSISFVATLRSDFYARAQQVPAFLRLKSERGVTVSSDPTSCS